MLRSWPESSAAERLLARQTAATTVRHARLAWAASALAHAAMVGALAGTRSADPSWEFAVNPGHPVTLQAAAAPPPEEVIPVSAVVEEPLERIPTPVPRRSEPEPPPLPEEVVQPELPPPPLELPAAAEVEMSEPPPPEARPVRRASRLRTLATASPAEIPLPPASARDPGADVEQPPRKLPSNPAPDYPLAARLAGYEGRVLLLVQVDQEGGVVRAEVTHSSGYPSLDAAAVEAVLRWKFTPALKGGRPVSGPVIVPIRFTLRR